MTNAADIAELFKAFDVPFVEAAQCPVCGTPGSLVGFCNQTLPLETPGGYRTLVKDLNGDQCQACGELLLASESAKRYADAGDALVVHARKQEAAKLRAARIHLGLSQEAASVLTGGGHNAFQRYEAGLAVPVPAVNHLMGLLANHPELAGEIPGVVVVKVPKDAKRRAGLGNYRLKIHQPQKPGPGLLARVNVGHLVAAQQTGPKATVSKRATRTSAKKTPR